MVIVSDEREQETRDGAIITCEMLLGSLVYMKTWSTIKSEVIHY